LLSFLAAPPRDGAGPSAALLAAGLAEPAPTRPGEAAAGTEPAGGGQGL
jgi:hypothetical protein